jgi:hypothetical protein
MSNANSVTLPAPELNLSAANGKWQREYQAFLRLKPQLMTEYRGQYVVVHEGVVVDSGSDKIALALRFFAQHGNVPIHIGLVTNEPEIPARIPHYRELRVEAKP